MNIDYKPENTENEQLELEEKNKQNSGISKPALYMGLSILGLALSGIAGKVIWDKLKKNDNNNPGPRRNEPNEMPKSNYNPNITIKDKNYLVAFNQKALADSYCFHNVWLQFLACPDIRCKKYGLPNTDKAISWINSVIAKEKDTMTLIDQFNDGKNYQSKAIDVPKEIRLQPEIKFKNPFTNEEIDVTNHEFFDVKKGAVPEGEGGASFPYAVSDILNACYSKKINVSDFMPYNLGPNCQFNPNDRLKFLGLDGAQNLIYNSWNEVPAVLLDLGVIKISNTPWRFYGVQDFILPQYVKNGNGPENFLAQIQLANVDLNNQGNIQSPNELIGFMQGVYGYKPTFGIMRFNGHYVSFYIFYDNSSNIKRVLYNAVQGFEQYSDNDAPGRKLQDFYKYIFDHHTPLWLKYSNQDIVKKYYTE